MSLFLPSIPQPGDNLDFSQGQLLSNNQGLDTVFGVDHYKFSDATANKGFHNTITTPVYVASPPTGLPPITTANPIFYGFQQSANTGVLQFSRGPTNAVPTPVTCLQSPTTAIVLGPGATTNLLDFTGLTLAICEASAISDSANNQMAFALIKWFNTATPVRINNFIGLDLGFIASGSILQLKNNSGAITYNVYWTLRINKMS